MFIDPVWVLYHHFENRQQKIRPVITFLSNIASIHNLHAYCILLFFMETLNSEHLLSL